MWAGSAVDSAVSLLVLMWHALPRSVRPDLEVALQMTTLASARQVRDRVPHGPGVYLRIRRVVAFERS